MLWRIWQKDLSDLSWLLEIVLHIPSKAWATIRTCRWIIEDGQENKESEVGREGENEKSEVGREEEGAGEEEGEGEVEGEREEGGEEGGEWEGEGEEVDVEDGEERKRM